MQRASASFDRLFLRLTYTSALRIGASSAEALAVCTAVRQPWAAVYRAGRDLPVVTGYLFVLDVNDDAHSVDRARTPTTASPFPLISVWTTFMFISSTLKPLE